MFFRLNLKLVLSGGKKNKHLPSVRSPKGTGAPPTEACRGPNGKLDGVDEIHLAMGLNPCVKLRFKPATKKTEA